MAIPADKLADLKSKHPKLFVITARYCDEDLDVYCKPPSKESYTRFQANMKAGDSQAAGEGFFADLVVYPDPKMLSEECYPVVDQVVVAGLKHLGMGAEGKAKKA